ncbi:hypothetical protein ABDZ21_02580 [Acinetobacter baumannii]|uniref:hypothetical protein n=1 Tax=Acinetobacter baumannii TaxID=470 RepID=UPI0002884D53|nr:hypothetical protein [Acinetobacter baumannii]EHU1480988.1 hypothetical protein [Acinetobacter baumannii]EHU1484462.1 hypothetical protein [Acinetobacter baumannii]EHU2701379.1 hypothetical protein [Acinetobacter baumannii]EHU2704842.1 hypothetical protein [Acinetobacter baumannii]EKU7310884.1 hypothetical protein [Acinetobacter baumannii]
MNSKIIFQDQVSFTQAAFNEVTRIISQHGVSVLDCLVPAVNTQQCLEHLAFVASEYGYDYSFIDAHLETYKKANSEFQDAYGEE